MTQLAVKQEFSLLPTTFEQAEKYAQMIARSSFCPPGFKGNPGDVLIAVQMGNELGLKPIQALQNIAVINGKPSIYGDAMLALVKSHPDFEWLKEEGNELEATCIIKRRGEPEYKAIFTRKDAETAGLWGKAGPWKAYPKRMLQMRARGFACRDAFPDALKGFISAEEAQDYPTQEPKIKDMGPADVVIAEPKHTKEYRDCEKKIKKATTLEELEKLAPACAALGEDEKKEIRKIYGDKKHLIESVEAQDDVLNAHSTKETIVEEDNWVKEFDGQSDTNIGNQ